MAANLNTEQLLAEAEKMRRVPGIHFITNAFGERMARINGTGLEVWEVVKAYRTMGESPERLRNAFHWLTDDQLRATLAYAEAYPQEIDTLIAEDLAISPEIIWEKYPFTKPGNK